MLWFSWKFIPAFRAFCVDQVIPGNGTFVFLVIFQKPKKSGKFTRATLTVFIFGENKLKCFFVISGHADSKNI